MKKRRKTFEEDLQAGQRSSRGHAESEVSRVKLNTQILLDWSLLKLVVWTMPGSLGWLGRSYLAKDWDWGVWFPWCFVFFWATWICHTRVVPSLEPRPKIQQAWWWWGSKTCEMESSVEWSSAASVLKTTFHSDLSIFRSVSVEVCNGQKSPGICKEISTRHAGKGEHLQRVWTVALSESFVLLSCSALSVRLVFVWRRHDSSLFPFVALQPLLNASTSRGLGTASRSRRRLSQDCKAPGTIEQAFFPGDDDARTSDVYEA